MMLRKRKVAANVINLPVPDRFLYRLHLGAAVLRRVLRRPAVIQHAAGAVALEGLEIRPVTYVVCNLAALFSNTGTLKEIKLLPIHSGSGP